MNFIIPYYEDERMIYTQKYLVNQGYHEVFDKSKADFAVFSPACDKESFAPYENKTVFYGAGDYDKKHKNFLIITSVKISNIKTRCLQEKVQ